RSPQSANCALQSILARANPHGVNRGKVMARRRAPLRATQCVALARPVALVLRSAMLLQGCREARGNFAVASAHSYREPFRDRNTILGRQLCCEGTATIRQITAKARSPLKRTL